nr:leucine-rich repeat extensin-like protein 5 [Penaeus vannamei]
MPSTPKHRPPRLQRQTNPHTPHSPPIPTSRRPTPCLNANAPCPQRQSIDPPPTTSTQTTTQPPHSPPIPPQTPTHALTTQRPPPMPSTPKHRPPPTTSTPNDPTHFPHCLTTLTHALNATTPTHDFNARRPHSRPQQIIKKRHIQTLTAAHNRLCCRVLRCLCNIGYICQETVSG